MVAEHPIRPSGWRKRRLIVGDQRREGARLPRRIDELEVEGQVHPCPFPAVIAQQPIDRQVDLADQHAFAPSTGAVTIGDGAHVGSDLVHLGLVGRMELEHAVHVAHRRLIGRVGRIVREVCRLDQVPQHVDAEAVHASLEPEAYHVVHRRFHSRITPIEVRLLLQEGVVVILAGDLVPFPCRAAEIADPVVGRPAIRRRVAPDVPVPFRIVARGAALDEPGMPVGCVVGHEVEQNLEPARMGLCKQTVKIGEYAEPRIDVAIIGDVIAEISHRRGVDG